MNGRYLEPGYKRDFVLTVFTQAGVFVLGIASSVLAARLLGPQGRGELAAVVLWPTLLTFMFSMGNTQSIAFHAGRRIFDISEVWTAAVVMGVVLSAFTVIAGLWIIPFALKQYSPEVRHLSQLFLACAPLIWLTSVPASLLQGRLEIGRFNLLKIICPAIYAAGLVSLYMVRKASVAWTAALQAIGFAVMDAIGVWLVFSRFGPRWAWNMRSFRSLLNFGWKTQLGSMASYVNQRLDQLLLTVFVPPRELGLYVVAVAVSTSLSFIPQAAEMVTLAQGLNSDPEQTKRIIARSFGVTLLALSVGCAALCLLCPWLVPLAFGESFAPAITACRILLPGSVALGLNQVLFSGARALGRPVLPSYAEGFAMAITCISLYCLLPRYGFIGAAIASTAAYIGSLIFSLALLCLRADIRPLELAAEFPRLALRRINL
jgi:O-antigen/teichoic acid export membrane protein